MAAGPLRYSSSVCQLVIVSAQQAALLCSGAAPYEGSEIIKIRALRFVRPSKHLCRSMIRDVAPLLVPSSQQDMRQAPNILYHRVSVVTCMTSYLHERVYSHKYPAVCE